MRRRETPSRVVRRLSICGPADLETNSGVTTHDPKKGPDAGDASGPEKSNAGAAQAPIG